MQPGSALQWRKTGKKAGTMHKRPFILLIAAGILLLLPGLALGESEADVIRDAEMGVSFRTPEGWKAQRQPDGYMLESDTYGGVIVVMPHDFETLAEMSGEAMEGIVDEESGTSLKPLSRFTAFGRNGLAGEFGGTFRGRPAKAYGIGLLSPQGGGVVILAAADTKSYTAAYPRFVQGIASSVEFARTQADASLMRYFAGKYYSRRGGSTMSGSAGTERQVVLCPDGAFYDSSEFSASGQGDVDWGGLGNARGTGRWSIRGSKTQGVITIERPDGSSEEVSYRVTGEEGVILFNGIVFAYAGEPDCR
jgi:hypothetical protein